MKMTRILPLLALLLLGCSEKKAPPTPPSYPLEVVEITIPSAKVDWSENSISNTTKFIEKLLQNPNAQTNALYLQVVEEKTVKNDQTKIVPMTSDSIPFDGTGKILKKPYKIGTSLQATLLSIEHGMATCKIEFYRRNLTGFNLVTTKDGREIEIPHFNAKIIKTELTLPSDSWFIMGGGSDKKQLRNTQQTNSFIVVRIQLTPPKNLSTQKLPTPEE